LTLLLGALAWGLLWRSPVPDAELVHPGTLLMVDLSEAVVHVLDDMQRDGSYQELMERYAGEMQPPTPPQAATSGFSWRGFFDYLGNRYLLMGALTTLWLTAA